MAPPPPENPLWPFLQDDPQGLWCPLQCSLEPICWAPSAATTLVQATVIFLLDNPGAAPASPCPLLTRTTHPHIAGWSFRHATSQTEAFQWLPIFSGQDPVSTTGGSNVMRALRPLLSSRSSPSSTQPLTTSQVMWWEVAPFPSKPGSSYPIPSSFTRHHAQCHPHRWSPNLPLWCHPFHQVTALSVLVYLCIHLFPSPQTGSLMQAGTMSVLVMLCPRPAPGRSSRRGC